MAYTILKKYLLASKYPLKSPYNMIPMGITVHNTYNDASAINEVKYMTGNDLSTSFHAAVDDINVVLAIPFNRNAWHAGDKNGDGNRKTIGIEICYSKSGGIRFDNAEKNAAKYIATLLKDYGWTVKNIYKHKDWSNKNCPHRTMANGWERFLNMVQNELDKLNGVSTSTTTTKPVASTTTSVVINKGTVVSIVNGAKYYNGKPVPSWIIKKNWIVKENPKGDRVVIDKSVDGKSSICSPISSTYLVVVSGGTTVSTPVNTVPTPTPVVQPTPTPTPAPTVQPIVQKSLDDWAKEVLNGKHGNGHANRETSLKKAGCTYAYADVKARVNELSGAKTTSTPKPIKSIDEWAKEVINGKHGNGHANREASLKKAGCTYPYTQVRARVNALSK